MKEKVITISRGPQFRNGKTAFLFIILLVLIGMLVSLLINKEFGAAIFLSPILVLITFPMLDIQGIEIDKRKNLIRTYKLHVWGKTGQWKDLQKFKYVSLDHQTYTVKIKSFYNASHDALSNEHIHEKHGHFLTTLIHENKNESIILTENLDYREAKIEALKISDQIDFPLLDEFRNRLKESKKRQRKKRK